MGSIFRSVKSPNPWFNQEGEDRLAVRMADSTHIKWCQEKGLNPYSCTKEVQQVAKKVEAHIVGVVWDPQD